ncbi:hypothetical protein NEIFL0001_2338 [Neisseria flavescens SK114]|nr:hypothetical protein NEIFL0001_2338 [Neisseria flavescens SK114]
MQRSRLARSGRGNHSARVAENNGRPSENPISGFQTAFL